MFIGEHYILLHYFDLAAYLFGCMQLCGTLEFYLMNVSFSVCREERGKEIKKEFHIFFVPRRSLLCEKRLQNKGVYGNFTIEEFTCELFPFENDLMSMEIENAFKVSYVRNVY